VYAAVSGSTPTTHGPASFDDWFAAHPGRQAPFSQLVAFDQSTGAYSFALPSFWPIDGEDHALSPLHPAASLVSPEPSVQLIHG